MRLFKATLFGVLLSAGLFGCGDDSAGTSGRQGEDASIDGGGDGNLATAMGAVTGRALLAGTIDGLGHGGIRLESVGTEFAAVTTSEGRFRLVVPAGEHNLRVSYPGYGTTEIEVTVEADKTHRLIDDIIIVARNGAIRGSVLVPPGFAANNFYSLLTIRLHRPDEIPDPDTSELTQIVGDGRYAYEEVSPGDWAVTVSAEGFKTQWVETKVYPGERAIIPPVQLQLLDELDPTLRSVIIGQVQLSGVSVDADRYGGILVESTTGPFATYTASDGRFTMNTIPGPQGLRVSYPGYGTEDVMVPDIEVGATHVLIDPIILVSQPGAVWGRVLLPLGFVGADGFDNVTVSLRRSDAAPGEDPTQSGGVDAQGRFNFQGVSPGDWQVTAAAPGMTGALADVFVHPGERTDVPPMLLTLPNDGPLGDTAIQGTALLPGVIAGGHGGIRVEAVGTPFTSTTSSDGLFLLPVTPGAHTLSFSFPGYGTVQRNIAQVPEGQTVNMDVNGDPAVLLGPPETTLTGMLSSTVNVASWPNTATVRLVGGRVDSLGTVNNDGSFLFEELPPGLCLLEVVAAGHVRHVQPITIVPGANALGAPVELVPDRRRVTGAILLQNRDEHSGVTVRARLQLDLVDTAVTDAAGGFELRLTPQNHSLTLSKAGFIERTIIATWDDAAGQFTVDTDAGTVALSGHTFTLSPEPLSDLDADGQIDLGDNCPTFFNPTQSDIDDDGEGDSCDNDMDGDLVVNAQDNCPSVFNPMQEDSDGNGTGIMCDGGRFGDPMDLGCGIANQVLDTSRRPDEISGTCGGVDSGEVVYNMGVQAGQQVHVSIEADHAMVLYVLDESGAERGCVLGTELTIGPLANGNDLELPDGSYLLVIDGLNGPEEAGAMTITIRNEMCGARDLGQAVAPPIELPDAVRDVAVADLDSDGDNEVVVLAGANVFRVDPSTGQSEQLNNAALPAQVSRLFIGDFDGDGRHDIATNSGAALFGQDNGDFLRGNMPVAIPSTASVVADFDQDGDVGFARIFGAQVRVQSGGQESILANLFGNGTVPGAITAGDLNADGILDLAVCTVGAGGTGFIPGAGDGSFDVADAVRIRETGCEGDGLVVADLDRDGQQTLHQAEAVADVDGDGFLDLLRLAEDAPAISVAVDFGDGLGGLERRHAFPRDVATQVRLGDINNDGLTDLLSWNSQTEPQRLSFSGSAPPLFAPGRAVEGEFNQEHEVHMGDVDGDGHQDLVSAFNPLTLRRGLGDGRFGDVEEFDFQVDVTVTQVLDMDGDGVDDVIVRTANDDTLLWLRDFPNRFDLRTDVSPVFGDLPVFLNGELGDINGDGLIDVATLSGNETVVGLGNQEGGYDIEGPIACAGCDGGKAVSKLVLRDLDGDGADEIIPYDGFGRTLTYKENSFGPYGPASNRTSAIAFGHFNDDGVLDMIQASAQGVGCLPGQPNGVFADPVDQGIVEIGHGRGELNKAEVHLKVADVNADGLSDVLVSHGNHRRLRVVFGGGECRFNGFQDFPSSHPLTDLMVDDLNGDGRLDVVGGGAAGQVFLHPKLLDTGAQLVNRDEPMCPGEVLAATTVEGSEATWVIQRPELCRVGSLEVEFTTAEGAILRGPRFELHTHSDTHTLLMDDDLAGANLLSTLNTRGLAKLQGYPLMNGRWRFRASAELTAASLRINAPVGDPFDTDNPFPACANNADSAPGGDCVLAGEVRGVDSGLNDIDGFVLTGPVNGGFLAGRQIRVSVAPIGAGQVISPTLAIHPLGARTFTTVRGQASVQAPLTQVITVPPEFDGRYFVARVNSQGAGPMNYRVTFEEGEF